MHEVSAMYIGGGVSELTFHASDTSAGSASITVPASAAVGDLAVLYQWSGGSPTPVNPAGFTTIATTTDSTGAVLRTCYKLLESGEPGASITGLDGTVDRKIILIFRPDNEIESVQAGSINEATATGSDPSSQLVNVSSIDPPLVIFGAAYASFDNNLSASPSFDAVEAIAPSNAWAVGYLVQNSSPSNASVSLTGSSGVRTLQSFYLSVS